jgi:hypothetical protein
MGKAPAETGTTIEGCDHCANRKKPLKSVKMNERKTNMTNSNSEDSYASDVQEH